MADFKGQKKGEVPCPKRGDLFLVAQDMVLSHRAKFQLIINFFRVKAISTGLYLKLDKYRCKNSLQEISGRSQVFCTSDNAIVN